MTHKLTHKLTVYAADGRSLYVVLAELARPGYDHEGQIVSLSFAWDVPAGPVMISAIRIEPT